MHNELVRIGGEVVSVDTNGTIIFDLDTSSSMRFAPQVPRFLNEKLKQLAQAAPGMKVVMYTVNGEITKVADDVTMADLPRIDESRWFYSRDKSAGGLLAAGSALSDVLLRSAKKGYSLRMSGRKGPMAIMLFADGYSRLDQEPESETREWLEIAREHGIQIRFVAFLRHEYFSETQRFVDAVGLKVGPTVALQTGLRITAESDEENEVFPAFYTKPEQLEQSMRDSVAVVEQEIRHTMFVSKPARKKKSDSEAMCGSHA